MNTKGRPTLYGARMRRVQVTLDEQTLRHLKRFSGSRSDAIRQAVAIAAAREGKTRSPAAESSPPPPTGEDTSTNRPRGSARSRRGRSSA